MSLDPINLDCSWIRLPGHGIAGWGSEVLPSESAVLVASSLLGLWRCDLKAATWTRIATPDARLHVRDVGGKVFVSFFGNGRRETDAGVGVGILNGSTIDWVVSTRRRPAKHPLDSLELANASGVFAGPGNKPWVLCGTAPFGSPFKNYKTYCLEETAEQEPAGLQLSSSPHGVLHSSGDGCTVIWEGYGSDSNPDLAKAWLIDSAKDKPERLLAFENDTLGKPRWVLPAGWAASYTASLSRTALCYSRSRDELWVLRWMATDLVSGAVESTLHGFLPGRTAPIKVPLKYVVSNEDAALFPASQRPRFTALMEKPRIKVWGMVATSHGLVLAPEDSPGIWVIPWRDIEAWIASHPPS